MTASVATQKNLLLSVTGMSPAVVTETLYGIAQRIKAGDKNAHWPDEIRIITTSKGKGEMVSRLVSGDWLRQVCEVVGQPVITMADEHILVVPGADGSAVEDARSEEDHEALANFITRTVRNFTSEDRLRIHASIAGGRKTMTFYLGYAMSLFGRHFDRMSHVLISEGFEFVRGFYFPGQEPHRLETGPTVLDTRDAKVTLADIPFIRMRHNLPAILQEESGSGDTLNYRKLVNLINLGDQPDRIHLRLTPKKGLVELFEGKPESAADEPVANFSLQNPVYMAIYTAMARVTKKSGSERCCYVRTVKTGDDESALYNDVALLLARVAGMVLGKQTGKALYAGLAGKIINDNEMLANLQNSRTARIVEAELTDRVSEIRQKIEGSITEQLKYYLIPSSAFNEKGEVVSRGKYYGLRLSPDQIEIVE